MDIKSLFAEGLINEFQRQTEQGTSKWEGLNTITSNYKTEGFTHKDEYLVGHGREIVKTSEGEIFIRAYSGDVISGLNQLGLSESVIMGFLAKIIVDHADKTRFDEDYTQTEMNWKYEYKVLVNSEDPFLKVGVEKIYYNNEVVFIHSINVSKYREA